MSLPATPFAFALCQPGTERLLKAEILRLRPDLHPGFQRPGMLTFKATARPWQAGEQVEGSLFGRLWACSAGTAAAPADVPALLARLPGRFRLLVGPRDQGMADEVPPARQAAADAQAAEWRAALSALLPGASDSAPVPGDPVVEVITSPGEPALVGWRTHRAGLPDAPGGRYAYDLPDHMPSRAWRKVTEGARFAGNGPRRGDRVLEIGASPGGGTLALLGMGASVVAVDPQPMDPAVLASPHVRWLPKAVGSIPLEELPGDLSWIVCDAGIAPALAIRSIRRLVAGRRRTIKGLFWTLKLNDAATVGSLPALLGQVREMGFSVVRARQLPSNRRDLFVFAEMPA